MEPTQLISIKNTAAMLGISDHTLRIWLSERKFPFVKIGRRTMLKLSDIESFIAANYVGAV